MPDLSTELRDVLPDYEIPEDDLIGEVLIPAMRVATDVWIGAGYFSAQCLAQLAPGLAEFIHSSPDRVLKLLLSPTISAPEQEAIDRGTRQPAEVIEEVTERIFEDAKLTESALVHHTLACLAYLIATDRLQLRFVLMRQGMYHKKKWLFFDGNNWAAVHGSGNATARGLLVNGEQMTVDRPWLDGKSADRRVDRMREQWKRKWSNRSASSLTLSAIQGLRFTPNSLPRERVPTTDDFWDAWRRDSELGLEPPLPPSVRIAPSAKKLRIPRGLEWRTGKYAHQSAAVDGFHASGCRGVLAIATGGGKTRTALLSAAVLQERAPGGLLLLILVPSRPLQSQWAEEVEAFGIHASQLSLVDQNHRATRLTELEAAFSADPDRTEVLILSNSLWAQSDSLQDWIGRLDPAIRVFLVGDEMHNLGASKTMESLPERADWRLGLSATPIRQYDPDGTDRLFEYFGPCIYEFGLADAIHSKCLAPYDYHLHEVSLTSEEMDRWFELTERLRRAGFVGRDEGQTVVTNQIQHNRIGTPQVERLLRERRAVLEQATGKIDILDRLLRQMGPRNVSRCLIYTSAKPSVLYEDTQLIRVNRLLADLGIVSHKYTNTETSRSDAREFLDAFERGDYQVLTAMKVLDEGIDLPETHTAFLMASSTVRREWVQRRGRILRIAPGKSKATLHDFLVLPPNPDVVGGVGVLSGEMARAEEFSSLATNEWSTDGPRSILNRLEGSRWMRR